MGLVYRKPRIRTAEFEQRSAETKKILADVKHYVSLNGQMQVTVMYYAIHVYVEGVTRNSINSIQP